MALGAAATLVALGAQRGDPMRILSFAINGTTLVSLFAVSTLYHSTQGPAKALFRKLDHVCIYLLIAGSYTPIALVTLNGERGWTLFCAVWALAILGIVQEIWIAKGLRLTSLAIYLLMGWLGIVAIEPLIAGLGPHGFAWMLAAGLVYTAGIVFYIYDERFTHWHGIWHCFVLAGSALHFAAIVRFVA
ncbi:MAG: hemolysin III family protein [Pseudomonadota bacterium]|nr:hemolysin III family protein [Pseudomonadota bacterium]